MSSPTYPSIPEPGNSVEALYQSVMQLKTEVEMLTGQRSNFLGAPRVFIQDAMPAKADRGDLWISTTQSNKLNYWDGTKWVQTT